MSTSLQSSANSQSSPSINTSEFRIHPRYPNLAEFYRGKKVLVTGATGFVGSHIARRLVEYGAHVRTLVRTSSKRPMAETLRKAGVELLEGDLTDRESVFRAVDGCEIVFHIGAIYREARFPDEVYFQINLEGTRHTLDASQKFGVKRYVYCSTNGVHSHIEHPPADENAPFNPADVYQVSKLEAEMLVRKYFEDGKVQAAIIRPAMIWGEEDTRFLKMFRGLKNRRLPMFGDGSAWTHWIYVHDLVDAFLLAGREPAAVGQVYLIAGARPVSLAHVFETIAKLGETKPFPFTIPHRPVQILGDIVERICKPFGIEPPLHRRRVDFFIKNRSFKIDKAVRELGFKPEFSFEQEADRIFGWYQKENWI